ncbi:LytTR family transcriptional regulator [Hymenobacter nivis]|uniref:LytTR family transcriptional regulator n=1 Tax=Hymenobacter nivis TaxID=1850093 RepID=A0A502GS69_9BACT|nr:LytTR family transcriptional regulator [Hymenobacter nivis]
MAGGADVLAAAPPQLFADLVHLAAVACGAPHALLALAGPGALAVQARQGRAAAMPELDKFCRAVLRAVPAAVGFNEVATSLSHTHFCAAVALRGPAGDVLGVLGVGAPSPVALPDDQREALACLARRATDFVAQGLAQQALADQQQQLAAAFRVAGAAEPGQRPELYVKQDTRLLRVLPADVTHLEALGDYVNLYTVRERFTVYGTMKDMEARLPTADFARIHRKYIIRLDRLLSFEGDTVLIDAGPGAPASRPATAVPVGNSYRAALLARLHVL